jgi:hypothetical protein
MSFRFYTNVISGASRAAAVWLFTTGVSLIGFGVLIYLLPRLFATLAAIILSVIGLGCVVTATRIFAGQRRLDKIDSEDIEAYRQNVQIHIEDEDE